jgi:hypothetical protein
MTDTEIVDVEEVTTDLVPVGQVSIYASQDPAAQLEEARARAKILVEVVKEQGLAKSFGGARPHVYVEGWVFLASQFGLIPDIEWTKELDDGWEARCALRRLSDGQVISHADAECRRTESNWNSSDSYAIRSMAQTRAESKVCRVALSSVMVMAGFAATPAEEMAGIHKPKKHNEPATADGPHCPACRAINGELVGVTQFDKKPFWRCDRRGDECAGSREYNQKTYSWSGWHESWERSAEEWLDDSGHGGPRTVEAGERGPNNWWFVLDEIEGTLGLTKTDAKALAKSALVYAINEHRFDPEPALGEPLLTTDLSDDQLATVAVNLDGVEAALVVGAAAELGEPG